MKLPTHRAGLPGIVISFYHAAIGAGLENGTLQPIIGQEMPLADAPRAHRKIIEATAFGKIVLVP